MSPPSPAQRLVAYWQGLGTAWLSGVDPEAIRIFERQNEVVIPPDLREYFECSNGTDGPDQNGYWFWRFEDLRPASKVYNLLTIPWAFIFADYWEESWWYAVDLGRDDRRRSSGIYLLGDRSGEPLLICDSFREFVELYISNDGRLNPRGAREYRDRMHR